MRNFLIAFFLTVSINSQSQILHKVIIHPDNITSNDAISVETQIAVAGTCSYIDSFTTVTGNNIVLYVCYLSIETGASVIGRDTLFFKLGALPDGTYTLKYVVNATEDTADLDCKYVALHDSTIKTFTVGINSIDRIFDVNFNSFPNPVANIVKIQTTSTFTGSYQLTTTTGQLLMQGNVTQPNFTIDVSTLPPGLYFVQLTNGRQRAVRKFVKQ